MLRMVGLWNPRYLCRALGDDLTVSPRRRDQRLCLGVHDPYGHPVCSKCHGWLRDWQEASLSGQVVCLGFSSLLYNLEWVHLIDSLHSARNNRSHLHQRPSYNCNDCWHAPNGLHLHSLLWYLRNLKWKCQSPWSAGLRKYHYAFQLLLLWVAPCHLSRVQKRHGTLWFLVRLYDCANLLKLVSWIGRYQVRLDPQEWWKWWHRIRMVPAKRAETPQRPHEPTTQLKLYIIH